MAIACQNRSEINTLDLEAMLASISELPTIPETLIHILNVIDDPDSGPADLAAAVRRDAPLMAKILKLANSPYYSPRGDIADINRCVAVLGYRTVQQVAIGVSVATVLVNAVADSPGTLDYRELWRHSVVTGAIAKYLAQMTGHQDPEEVFTAGLLHDVGKFILEIHDCEGYARVISNRAAGNSRLVDAEFEAFGFDHAIIGAAFARSWRFPAVLVEVFGEHHEIARRDLGASSAAREIALVSLADYLANTMEPPRGDLGFDPSHTDVETLHLAANVTIEAVEENLAAIRESVANASSFLTIS